MPRDAGYYHILGIRDNFSGLICLIPVKNKSSNEVKRANRKTLIKCVWHTRVSKEP